MSQREDISLWNPTLWAAIIQNYGILITNYIELWDMQFYI